MSKKYDLTVVTGEYTNHQGEVKKQYKNVGVMMEGQNGPYIILDRTFNPAGLPNPENRSNCIVSMFEPRDNNQQQARPRQPLTNEPYDNDVPDFGKKSADIVPY